MQVGDICSIVSVSILCVCVSLSSCHTIFTFLQGHAQLEKLELKEDLFVRLYVCYLTT